MPPPCLAGHAIKTKVSWLRSLAIVTAISLALMCIRSVLLRRAEIARQQGVLEALRQAEQGIPTGQQAGAPRVDAIMRWAFLQQEANSTDGCVRCVRPAPVHAHPNTNEEIAIEPLPIYEAPPPKYSSVIKETQPPADTTDLERGEPSGRAEAGNNPPEYNQGGGGDEVTVVVRVATDGSHMAAPEGERRRGIFSMTRPF